MSARGSLHRGRWLLAATLLLPTDLALSAPGVYRAALVVEENGAAARDFGWVFTYDLANYAPATTRARIPSRVAR